MANFPTYWSNGWDGNGLGISAEGFGVEAGLDYFEFRITGTASGVTSVFGFEDATIIPASIGEDWTQSFYLWRVAGDFTGLNDWQLRLSERLEGGGFGDEQVTNIVPTTDIQQFSHTRTLTGSDTFWVLPRMGVSQLSSGAVDATMRVASVSTRLSTPVVYTDAEIINITRLPTQSPRYRSILGYAKNYTVDNGQGLDAAATDAFVAFARQEFRTAQKTDSSVLIAHPQADERRVDTAILGKTDAAAEVDVLQTLYGQRRDMFLVELLAQPFAVDVGNVVTLQTEILGLSAGKKFIIVSLGEEAAENEITIVVWG